jgi:transposase InsO family protein
MAHQYHLRDLCQALRVPRSSYYAWRHRQPSAREQHNELLRATLSNLFVTHRKVYGSPRMTACLNRAGLRCSRNRVARHMRDLGLKARQKRSFKPKTTDSNHPHPIAPNRLADAAQPKSSNRIWVSDITYIHTAEGWLYLAAVMDLYSRKVVGWATADHLKTSLVERAMVEALRRRRPAKGLLHHSDRGCQYASTNYRQLLSSFAALPSMSSTGNCYDNAAMESFWSTLKTEWLHHRKFATHGEAKLAIFDYIETFYNPKRLHSALGYLSPVEFESKGPRE